MKFHLSIDVRGAIKLSNRELAGMFRYFDGRKVSGNVARDYLMDELAKGHVCIPATECDNFDYAGGGCRGHKLTQKGGEA